MENTGTFNQTQATTPRSAYFIDKVHRCEDCPIRQLAIKRPRSVFAKIHTWHKTWWPGWQARQARDCAFATVAAVPAGK
jgi:hypothetical protein